MTQTPGPMAGPTQETAGLDRFFDWLRSLDLRRDGEEKWVAGVCSGIANRLGVDPIVIRAALVLLVIMGGVGVTIYLVAWGFIANDREEIVAERAIRHGDVLGIILLVVIGLSLIGGTGFADNGPGFVWFWWLAVPVAVVVWLVTRNRERGGRSRAAARPTGQWAPSPTSTPVPPWAPGQEPTMTYAAPPAPAGTAPTAPFGAGTAAPADTTLGAPQGYPAAGHAPAAPTGAPPQTPFPPSLPAPKPPRAPRPPRRRGAGFVGAVLVSGLALAAYGLTLWLHDNGNWAGSGETVALAAALGVFGISLVALGVGGFRAGLTAFIAVLLAITTWTASVVPNLSFGGGIGDRVWRPTATDTNADHRFRLGIGSAELDLSDLPDNPGSPTQVEAGVGIGELKIRIPSDLTVQVRSEVGAGDISQTEGPPLGFPGVPSDQDLFNSSTDGRGGRDISTTETFGTGSPDVVVDAHVGLGQILIGKE